MKCYEEKSMKKVMKAAYSMKAEEEMKTQLAHLKAAEEKMREEEIWNRKWRNEEISQLKIAVFSSIEEKSLMSREREKLWSWLCWEETNNNHIMKRRDQVEIWNGEK